MTTLDRLYAAAQGSLDYAVLDSLTERAGLVWVCPDCGVRHELDARECESCGLEREVPPPEAFATVPPRTTRSRNAVVRTTEVALVWLDRAAITAQVRR